MVFLCQAGQGIIAGEDEHNEQRDFLFRLLCLYHLLLHRAMENQTLHDDNMVESEYVLLDLDGLPPEVHIPPGAPYVLSGLDTLNPILTIDGKIKLIGQYDETIGTCLIFDESDASSMVNEETGPSEANLYAGRLDPKQTESKQVKPVTKLQKILKFRLLHQDSETDDAREKPKEDR